MKGVVRTISLAGLIGLSLSPSAQALPDMTVAEMRNWFNQNASVSPLQPTQKYEPGMSDFDSTTEMDSGKAFLSIFLNSQNLVESETIDYRPNCYFQSSPPTCTGTVRFDPAERRDGSQLIQTMFGKKILADFQASTLTETDIGEGINGITRWYQGKTYNYETWHYDRNATIVHFSVVSKQSPQAERIQRYRHCLEQEYC